MVGEPTRGQGWYQDVQAGGTRFWDGARWTGDVRPPRKGFAAASGHQAWGITLIVVGIIGALGMFTSESPLGTLTVGLALAAWGLYLFRGKGPTTKSVITRLNKDRMRDPVTPQSFPAPQPPTINIHVSTIGSGDSVAAAQIRALANPETAKALQNLQNLLYTRTITDAEYEAAKRKLLGEI